MRPAGRHATPLTPHLVAAAARDTAAARLSRAHKLGTEFEFSSMRRVQGGGGEGAGRVWQEICGSEVE